MAKKGNDVAQVVEKLMTNRWKIAFAESCTGGLACARLVEVPNASQVLDASFVTYANEAKMALVGVLSETLARFGAVSEEVAYQMAQGAAEKTGAAVGVGISGIAGPTGGTKEKPVGTVCFGFYIDGNVFTRTLQFGNLGRQEVRTAAVDFVFETLNRFLSDALEKK